VSGGGGMQEPSWHDPPPPPTHASSHYHYRRLPRDVPPLTPHSLLQLPLAPGANPLTGDVVALAPPAPPPDTPPPSSDQHPTSNLKSTPNTAPHSHSQSFQGAHTIELARLGHAMCLTKKSKHLLINFYISILSWFLNYYHY
jgi:hypothetical protein